MNQVRLSGIIEADPEYHTVESTGTTVARFVLVCGAAMSRVSVYASRGAVEELREFGMGDSISIDGRLTWDGDKLEILAERIRRFTQSFYRPVMRHDRFPRQYMK